MATRSILVPVALLAIVLGLGSRETPPKTATAALPWLKAHGSNGLGGAHTLVFLPLVVRQDHIPVVDAQKIAHFAFNEPPGTTVFTDSTGLELYGTCKLQDCPMAGIWGRSGTALRFGGPQNGIAISVREEVAAEFADTGFSLGFWFYPTTARCGFCRIVNRFDPSTGRGWALDLADGQEDSRLTFYASNGAESMLLRTEARVLLNEWHHVVVAVDGPTGQVQLFVDGTLWGEAQAAFLRKDAFSLTRQSPLRVGSLEGESDNMLGMFDELSLYRGPLSAPAVAALYTRADRPNTPGFSLWNAWQVLTLFRGFGLDVLDPIPVSTSGMEGIEARGNEGAIFRPGAPCEPCLIWVFTFSDPGEVKALRDELTQVTKAAREDLFIHENVLLRFEQVPMAIRPPYQEALSLGMLGSVLDAPNNLTDADFESWRAYYPIDRGQQSDLQRGRSQRTYDRWEGPNRWLFGQSTWLYMDPDEPGAPPPGLPTTYRGRPLTYYYHYHCEPQTNPDTYTDCTNWQIYIELLSMGKDETELYNWARGGWGSLSPKPVHWEAYYPPAVFDERCETNDIRQNFSSATLQNPQLRAPLAFRLPSQPGLWNISPEVCALTFNNYLYTVENLRQAKRWRVFTRMLAKEFDTATQRFVVKAENQYYERIQDVDGEAIYRKWAHEIYWSREVKPDTPRLYGLEAFWWWTWERPPERYRDYNLDPTWSELQWCYVDPSRGPKGLGTLVCEP